MPQKTHTMDMTQGPLLKKILLFSLPLMVTNLLQMLFNAADVIVVGRFAGFTSLAAVGSTGSIIYLCTNLLIGFSVGVNVLVAKYAGAGHEERNIFLTLHTAVTLGLVGGICLGAVGFLAAPLILQAMSTPPDVYGKTLLYLRIYFLGTPFVMLYNYGTAVLRAIGDTRRPMIFLLVSGLTNLILNLFTVISLGWDVAGVGTATVVSQALSAVLVLGCLSREEGPWQYHWKLLLIDRRTLWDLARIGLPAGFQACMFSISNVVIQGAVNSYGSVVMAANSAGNNIGNFLYIAMNSFHQAALTFISQNLGAQKWERIKKVAVRCLLLTGTLGIIAASFVNLFAAPLIRIFNTDPRVVEAGVQQLHWTITMYAVFGLADVLVGCIRGFGITVPPMLINLLGTCAFRVLWITWLHVPSVPVTYVYASYPMSWTVILVLLAAYWKYLYGHFARRKGL